MKEIAQERLAEAIGNFKYEGKLIQCRPYGSGHINDTFLLVYEIGENGQAEGDPAAHEHGSVYSARGADGEHPSCHLLSEGAHCREQRGPGAGDAERDPGKGRGRPTIRTARGNYWRSYKFITGATSYDKVEKPADFYESAVAFGNFQRLLADFPAETLHETIKGFHDTRARFAVFEQAVKEDVMGRASSVEKEIEFVRAREKSIANYFSELLEKGELPLRVTHNDTKLNNIMIDDKTGRGICVIDLDTVMPGLAMNDFGDSIRFGASTASEDERDLSLVSCSMELFDIYARGYIEGCGGKLTDREILELPMGAKTMTYECGMRFLTDYLQGDTYFKIHRKDHNLDRCRTQFKLVADMEQKWHTMQAIVKKYM